MSKPALAKLRAPCSGSYAIALLRRCAALAVCRFRQAASALTCVVAVSAAQAQDPIPGSLDLSFGGGTGRIANLAIGTGNDAVRALGLQPDGKIVLAGECLDGNYHICVARLNDDGTLDTSFDGPDGNGNGKFILRISANGGGARTVVLQPDGKIVLAGYCIEENYHFCIARLNVDGTFDLSFNGPAGNGGGRFVLPMTVYGDVAAAVALQPDGKILLTGQCTGSTNQDFCAARLRPDGTLDKSFAGPSGDGGGKFLWSVGTGYDYATALALQPDGKIVLAGYCGASTNADFCLTRLSTDGTLDTSFQGPGGTGDGKFLLPIGTGNGYATAISLQSDGKIVSAGECLSNGKSYFCTARLNTDGSLDTSFDGSSGSANGGFLLPIGPYMDRGTTIAVQPDGKIVVAGECGNGTNNDFCVARLHGGPFGAKQCSLDIDGDGKVSAGTDMLIGTRVALGMTGSAVLSGIVFAPHATRTTWPDIRTYLVSQCGMVIRP